MYYHHGISISNSVVFSYVDIKPFLTLSLMSDIRMSDSIYYCHLVRSLTRYLLKDSFGFLHFSSFIEDFSCVADILNCYSPLGSIQTHIMI